MENKFYIKDIADKFNVKESLLRYYDSKGLIKKFKRDENGYRYMIEEDLSLIHTILCLKKTDMPLKEIINYVNLVEIGDSTLEERLQMISKQEKIVLKKQEEINEQFDFINFKMKLYKDLLNEKK
ncbi:MerR family transcriptional regulator [Mesoplasma photuris]|uniref:MerR family transcriptional regulator n=1 Tax=Mesoplasma photuris TaxID=217731 RepID=UPI0006903805|nr:MerR family transcriptional regulator [Mesoplasma photuris]